MQNNQPKTSILIGSDASAVQVFPRKSRLAKRVIIRISKRNGVELIVPTRASMKSAIAFLHTKQEWVLSRCAEIKKKGHIKFEEGATVNILGTPHTICHSGNLRGVTKQRKDD